jgi:hypothetical protein
VNGNTEINKQEIRILMIMMMEISFPSEREREGDVVSYQDDDEYEQDRF